MTKDNQIFDLYNPFKVNKESFRLFQNEPDSKLRIELLKKEAELRSEALQNQMTQKESLTNEELIDALTYKGETPLEIPPLRCDQVIIKAPSIEKTIDVRYGVRAQLTNKRLILTDVDVTPESSVFLLPSHFPERKKYRISHSIRDDLWYYPFPLKNIKGISLSISNKTTTSTSLSRKYNYYGLALAILGLLVMLIGLPIDMGIFGFGILLLVAGIIIALVIPMFSMTPTMIEQGMERLTQIGLLDPLTQRHIILELYINENYSIHAIKDYLSKLQEITPDLSG